MAGKSIARNFSQNTDCVVRYTRENPRTGHDAPDALETRALPFREEFYGQREAYDVPVPRAIPVYMSYLPWSRWRLDEAGFPVRATS